MSLEFPFKIPPRHLLSGGDGETVLDYPGGPHVTTKVLMSERARQKGQSQGRWDSEAEVGETCLLAWKMGGFESRDMAACRSLNTSGNEFHPRALRSNTA